MTQDEFVHRMCELGECRCERCVALAPYLPDGQLRRPWTHDVPDVLALMLWLALIPLLGILFIFDFDL